MEPSEAGTDDLENNSETVAATDDKVTDADAGDDYYDEEEDGYYDEEDYDGEDEKSDSDSESSEESDEPDWLKEELIASKKRARWGETAARPQSAS